MRWTFKSTFKQISKRNLIDIGLLRNNAPPRLKSVMENVSNFRFFLLEKMSH